MLDADEPVSLAQAKAFIEEDRDTRDELIETLILAAREWAEERTGLWLKARERVDIFDDFTAPITLSLWPIDADSVTIDYADETGYEQGFDDFVVQTGSRPATIVLATDASWPAVSSAGQAVTITYDAGYAAYTEVPNPIRLAIMMLVAGWYDRRSGTAEVNVNEVPFGVEEMLRRYRPIAVA